MKKLMATMMAALLVLSLAACGGKADASGKEDAVPENRDLLCFPLKNLVISGVSAYQILKPYVLSLVFSLTG